MADFEISEIERKILCAQIKRREKYREEFLRLRTDPCKNAMEAGHVFDPALQRFLAMKTLQYDTFYPNRRNGLQAVAMLLPMVLYGYVVWDQRTKFLNDCRCGRIKYRNRRHKFS